MDTTEWRREIDFGNVVNIAKRWRVDEGGCIIQNIYAKLHFLFCLSVEYTIIVDNALIKCNAKMVVYTWYISIIGGSCCIVQSLLINVYIWCNKGKQIKEK